MPDVEFKAAEEAGEGAKGGRERGREERERESLRRALIEAVWWGKYVTMDIRDRYHLRDTSYQRYYQNSMKATGATHL